MDVKEVLDDNNIDYRNSGKDYLVRCLNPEHDDSKPSMRIDKITGMFGCFSCGFSGDIYKHFGIENTKYLDIKVMLLKDKINKLMWSKPIEIPLDASFYNSDFRNISASTYKEFNAFTTESIPELEGRLVIPITDITGNIVCLNGRFMYSDLDPKYKFYPSNSQVPLFPAKPNIIDNSIILVEGIFDLLNLWDKGLTNTVCVFGTAFGNVKKKQKIARNIDRLLQYKYQGVDTIYILFDGDKAGRDSAESLEYYIGDKFKVKVLHLEDGVDPGSLTRKEVKELASSIYG